MAFLVLKKVLRYPVYEEPDSLANNNQVNLRCQLKSQVDLPYGVPGFTGGRITPQNSQNPMAGLVNSPGAPGPGPGVALDAKKQADIDLLKSVVRVDKGKLLLWLNCRFRQG